MGQMPPSPRHAKTDTVVVALPCGRDAVGGALRDVYARDRGLPDDMARLLYELDLRTTKF